MSFENRARGVLLGLASGDALGRPVEFNSPEQIERKHGTLDEMVGNGAHGKPAGTITDDTELTLRIARSLDENGGFDGEDVARRFVEWYRSGPFDIGMLTADALRKIDYGVPWDEAGRECWEERPEGQNAGNGSVMRCAPYAVFYSDEEDRDRLVEVSKASSGITHADPRCTYGCAVLNLTIAGLLNGDNSPLKSALNHVSSEAPDELIEALEPVTRGHGLDGLSNSGYVVDTLQTALHDALSAESAEDAIITSVNRGGDADTIGAVAGAVAGARFGVDELPERWLGEIDERDELEDLATRLL